MPDNDSDQSSANSSGEDRGGKTSKKSRIREGRRRKGGINEDPKTPRPEARPQPQKPSDSSSDGSDESGESDD
jgi:hypothetical protein